MKYALVDSAGSLRDKGSFKTPETLTEFYREVIRVKESLQAAAPTAERLQKILDKVEVARIKPKLLPCQHGNDANLLGAVVGLMA